MDSTTAKMRRARRRERTLAIAGRRRDAHLRRLHYDDTTGFTEVDCVCELSNTFFAKRTAFGCDCRKRSKGRPKVGGGMCKIGAREHIITRRQARRQLRAGHWEVEERYWPSGKTGPKTFTIDKRQFSRDGEAGAWWTELRKYRTARGRDQALISLSRSVRNYSWLNKKGYTGPMCEYRVGGSGEPVSG